MAEELTQAQLNDIANFVRASTPIDQLVRQDYPQMAWVLNNPELGPIMRQAVTERWDPARLMGAIQKTAWWTNTSAAQREWQRLQAEDPMSALTKLVDAYKPIKDMADRLGVYVSPEAMKAITIGQMADGWDQTRVTAELIRQSTSAAWNGAGDLNAMTNAAMDRANEFFMPMSKETAFTWAKNMLIGAASKEGFDSYLRQQAVYRFAGDKSIVDALNQGATVKDIFDPYAQQTAQLLEVAPSTVNLMDQQWGTMIDGMRSDGTRRPMTLSESATYVRGTDQWKTTKQAGEAAAGLAETINKTFGEVA